MHINTISMELSILYIKGLSSKVLENDIFYVTEDCKDENLPVFRGFLLF